MKYSIKEIVYIGIFSGLVIVGTFINFILPFAPQGGLVHLGTVVSVIAIIVGGPRIGILSGAIGMTIFDIIGGWFVWAPGTLIARLGLAYLMSKLAYAKGRNADSLKYNIFGLVLGGLWMIVIYYIYEGLLYSNFISPIASISGNVLQLVFAFIIGIPLGMALKKRVVIN